MQNTLKNFLSIAFEPIYKTMYIFGGGWNKADSGAGYGACRKGISPMWQEFCLRQTSDYDYKKHLFKNECGLDCSGYVGWVLYNYFSRCTLCFKKSGYVFKASNAAKEYANMGLGEFTHFSSVADTRAGDIMSSKDHIYISLGTFSDTSTLLIHSSPPGVQLSGTYTKSGNPSSMAIRTADEYTKKYFPVWHKKFGTIAKDTSYLSDYSRFRWDLNNKAVMTDPDGVFDMSPSEILAFLKK